MNADADSGQRGHMTGTVEAVSASPAHTMSKANRNSIALIEGLGVDGDVHKGATVKHRSRVHRDPTKPNLRQVHLIHSELIEELRGRGFELHPGRMGENITTRGLDLPSMPRGTLLHMGEQGAVVKVTGLRNPCVQLDGIQPGLMKAVLDRDRAGNLIRRCGVMGVVVTGGEVRPGDVITAILPPRPHAGLEPV